MVDACQEYGSLIHLGKLHEATKRSEIASGTSQMGQSESARCASGMGCFVTSCIAASCGGSTIELSGGVGGLSFTTSSPTILDASLTNSHLCALCTAASGPGSDPDPCNPDGIHNETDDGSCCQGTCTPILINLGGGEFRLSGPEPPVSFDIDADGMKDLISWTRVGGDEAFLALDRNGNGVIDDGTELFGAATEQPATAFPNGYLALAVFDDVAHGGNGDGVLTADDGIFNELLLWIDADRNGISEPWELRSLAEHGIVEIGLDFRESGRRDRWGNRFRWSGRALTSGGAPVQTSDVVFVSAPASGSSVAGQAAEAPRLADNGRGAGGDSATGDPPLPPLP